MNIGIPKEIIIKYAPVIIGIETTLIIILAIIFIIQRSRFLDVVKIELGIGVKGSVLLELNRDEALKGLMQQRDDLKKEIKNLRKDLRNTSIKTAILVTILIIYLRFKSMFKPDKD